jgi:hypothetical protein
MLGCAKNKKLTKTWSLELTSLLLLVNDSRFHTLNFHL